MVEPPAHRPPFPVGWFVVAGVDELPEGALVPLAAFGQDLAVGRTPDGRALVTHSVCPHLGADLAAGGRIDEEGVVCPLHEWCFSHGGACTSAADGPIPETARLRVWPTEVVDGTVWAFNGRDGEQPSASPPVSGGSGESRVDERPGHPEDVLVGVLASGGVADGAPAADDSDKWEGTTPDGRVMLVHGPGTAILRSADGASSVVHVTPVDGFTVTVRLVGGLPLPDVESNRADLPGFRSWYRRFDRSAAPARSPARSGRSGRAGSSGRRQAQASETPAD